MKRFIVFAIAAFIFATGFVAIGGGAHHALVTAASAHNNAVDGVATVNFNDSPWEQTLGGLVNTLTGRTAKFLIILAMVGTALMLFFRPDHSEFIQQLTKVVVVGAIILGAQYLVQTIASASAITGFVVHHAHLVH